MTVAAATAALAAGGSRASSKALAASQPQHSAAIFKHAWQVYHKLLEVDFLEHRCLYTALQELLLGQLADGRARSLLDLGCGDAMQIARTLERCGSPSGALRLASYTGVDVAAPALSLAEGYLAFLQPACPVTLIEGDMKEFVSSCPAGQYDLVFASFAVHHLSLEGKAEFAAQVARCLAPGGAFLLVDIFMREGEERAGWLGRYSENMDEAVGRGIVEAPEAELIMDHIVNFDFPERMSTWRQLAADAGFSSCEELCVDSKQFGRLALLRKAADADAATAAASPHN